MRAYLFCVLVMSIGCVPSAYYEECALSALESSGIESGVLNDSERSRRLCRTQKQGTFGFSGAYRDSKGPVRGAVCCARDSSSAHEVTVIQCEVIVRKTIKEESFTYDP